MHLMHVFGVPYLPFVSCRWTFPQASGKPRAVAEVDRLWTGSAAAIRPADDRAGGCFTSDSTGRHKKSAVVKRD